ncbi:MAG: DNA polymerase III subunit alpha [Maricaulaceae bacterium]
MAEPFVHVRCRSAYSLLQGAILVRDMPQLCLDAEMPALALTDANNLFGALEFSETLSEAGVQPILGVTLSVNIAPPRLGERPTLDGELVLLAQSEHGLARLMALSSAAYLEISGADEPHVTLEAVLAEPEGLIALTGGYEGVISRLLAGDRGAEAEEVLKRMREAFGDRLYVELHRHGRADEARLEPAQLDLAYRYGLPLVAGNDPHFARAEQYEAHDALLCMAEGTYRAVEDRRMVTPEHWFKPGAAMVETFADLPEALLNTAEIAQRCAVRAHTRKPLLPRFDAGEGRDEAAELRVQAEAGLAARLKTVTPSASAAEYQARLDHELSVIAQMGFPGYFLIVADFIQWAKAQGIPVGPGRGSGAGSLVAWALTITDLDPLRFGLLFERFLNPERVSMPDFDIDFCQDRRGEVIEYVTRKYGLDRVAQIITFGTLQARAVVRDVGRVMQLPFGLVDRLAKMIPANPANPVTLAQALESEPRLQEARREDADVDALFDTALKLEGLYRNASTHAAGVVIGDRPLVELTPLYRDPRSELPATQYNMAWVERAGLVKFDFLGLKTLTVIARALEFLDRQGRPLDLDAIPLDDPKTFALLSEGAAIGVFQLESSGMRDTLKKMRPDKIEDLIALISLYRPGPMKNIDVYVDRKFGRAEPDYLHPTLEPVLKETYGVIIYQEQVMQIAQILSGYSLGEADLLRRAMGKKKKAEMDRQKSRFLSGAAERGVEAAKAAGIFDLVAEFAGYGFNKSHAAAYGKIAYQTAYLKANYPVEFMAALMSLDRANTDKLAVLVQEARRMGITVRPPDVNAAGADFQVQEGAVRYALGAVKSVSVTGMAAIEADRAAGGAFSDVFDFAERVDPKFVNKRAFEALARAGAFDSLHSDRGAVFASADKIQAWAQKARQDRAASQSSLFEGAGAAMARPDLAGGASWGVEQRLDEELSAVGFYLTGHPLEQASTQLARRGVVFAAALTEGRTEGREAARMAGIVRRRQERVSQAGKRFAFIGLSDPTGDFEVLAPPEVLSRLRDTLAPGARLELKVRLGGRDGEVRLFLDDATPIDAVLEGGVDGLRVDLVTLEAASLASEALNALKGREGGKRGSLTLRVRLSSGKSVEIAAPGRWPVDAAAQAALSAVPGVGFVEAL